MWEVNPFPDLPSQEEIDRRARRRRVQRLREAAGIVALGVLCAVIGFTAGRSLHLMGL